MASNYKENDVGGEFISPKASKIATLYILKCRALMYANNGQVIKHAITSGKSLATGAAATLAMIVSSVQQKMGKLSPEDLQMVVAMLAGTIVSIALKQKDPDATHDDGTTATH